MLGLKAIFLDLLASLRRSQRRFQESFRLLRKATSRTSLTKPPWSRWDLALLYAEQDKAAELKKLAAEIVPIFASRQIHREALAALSFLQRAMEAERAGIQVAERVADYLRKARYAPDLFFQKSFS